MAGKPTWWPDWLPYLDTSVQYCGTSRLRTLNAQELRHMKGALVIQDASESLVVIVPYKTFLEMQKEPHNASK